nr:MAG TPA: hypothetical protein [Caudoviricetes sp.]
MISSWGDRSHVKRCVIQVHISMLNLHKCFTIGILLYHTKHKLLTMVTYQRKEISKCLNQ